MIDYAAIIAKANERKEALQRATELLIQAPDQFQVLWDAARYLNTLKAKLESLDTEGREMLGADDIAFLGTFIARFQATASSFMERDVYRVGTPHDALNRLVEKVK